MRRILTVAVFTALVALALLLAADSAGQELLMRHRNLGKAFYENPTTQAQAVDEFKKALDLAPKSARERVNYGLALLRAGKTEEGIAELEKAQKQDPKIPHTWFNLGIAYKKAGQFDRAAAEFQQMIRLVPDEPVSHYNLGVLYKIAGDTAGALKEFETAERLNPNLAGPHFQLYNAYRLAGRAPDAARELRLFQEIKKRTEGAAVPEDMEWSYYSEIYEIVEPKPAPRPVVEKHSDRKIAGGFEPATARLVMLDAGHFVASSVNGIHMYRSGGPEITGTGLEGLKDVLDAAPGDFDNDGLPDLCIVTRKEAAIYHNEGGKFRKQSSHAGRFVKAVWLDYDHDNDLDLFLLGEDSALLRNNGAAGFSDETARFPFVRAAAVDAVPFELRPDVTSFDLLVAYADRPAVLYHDKLAGKYEVMAAPGGKAPRKEPRLFYDFDGDGRVDEALIGADGVLSIRHNDAPDSGHWLRIALEGVKSLRLAQGAGIEVKAGALYERVLYAGVPVTFRLGAYRQVDTVRITWPNGLIQNETQQPVDRAITYKEAPRLSGSCPLIFTWNGRTFEFITDVLGVAPLGASSGDGQYFPVDHDEYVQIPGESLVPRDGRYEVRITEELREVAYLDQVRLIALDHPAQVEIFTNEKFKTPPYPDFRLYGATRRIYPRTPRTLRNDFRRDGTGVAELHRLDLDFGGGATGDRALLVLRGRTDWADGSAFLNAAQQHKDLVFPYLQVKDAAGQWRTVIADMGMPSGKAKTIAVEVPFLSRARQIRIVTSLCVYWNEAFLVEPLEHVPTRLTPLDPDTADLGFRGFSQTLDYARVTPTSLWNPTPGLYTRYGDVRPLVTAVDDRFVIMGSGDELRLKFPARQLPPLPHGWRRDFLLFVDGWAKDGDANTAFSQSVEPLPFHAMTQYPYTNGEHFPDDEGHREYRERYNTRPALRLLRPLVAVSSSGSSSQ